METDLTDEQIENWRKALAMSLGSYAFLMTKEQIQAYRNKMQEHFNEKSS